MSRNGVKDRRTKSNLRLFIWVLTEPPLESFRQLVRSTCLLHKGSPKSRRSILECVTVSSRNIMVWNWFSVHYKGKGMPSVVSKVVGSRSNQNNPQNLRCPSCKSGSIAIKLKQFDRDRTNFFPTPNQWKVIPITIFGANTWTFSYSKDYTQP